MNRALKKILFASFSLSVFVFGFQYVHFEEPKISLEAYKIEEGFDLSVIASEPLFKAPVSMDFDNNGRMWIVEMIGYMPNLGGSGEEEPNGRISILEDRDKDGMIDHSKVFLDKLVLPRGLAHVYGGLLYVDGPKLMFVEINNDKPGKKTLVDPIYAEGGNVEHSSNGLMMNIDNWIYNANYNFRYQLKNGKWLKEPTSYRGQWGVSKDNFGRLYFNNNSTQLQGDYVLPNKVIRNKYFKPTQSEGQRLTNNKVFPTHATSVNRGYQKGVLDERGYLKEVTAACGPLIYRGGAFPAAYNQNAFVCVPEANLIKRNVLNFDKIQTSASQAIAGVEFISSTDEGFRPVNIFNGPDGAMFIVDMHRGIIQHKAYISQYLTEQLSVKKLDTLQNSGRILKVVNKSTKLHKLPNLTKANNKELLALLSHPNGWLRDRVQQILIQKKDKTIAKDLVALTQTNNEYSTAIHALYLLDGLNLLNFGVLYDIMNKAKQAETIAHALGLSERFATIANSPKMKEISSQLLAQNNEKIDLYLAFSMNAWLKTGDGGFLSLLSQIEKRYPENRIFQEAIISSLEDVEEKYLQTENPNTLLKNNIKTALNNHQKNEINPIFSKETKALDTRTKAMQLFKSTCATCHGADGKGIQDLAPPLHGSEYIEGSPKRLAAIILHGISGPITVNGQLYQLNNEMPALINNTDVSDEDIVILIRFIQNAFAKEGKGITLSDVKKQRANRPPGSGIYNEKLLLETDFEK
jgi:putative membrane-bound dehydrogenase-like protein